MQVPKLSLSLSMCLDRIREGGDDHWVEFFGCGCLEFAWWMGAAVKISISSQRRALLKQ